MNTEIKKFEIFVNGKLRFIKNNVRDKEIIRKELIKKGIDFKIKEHKLY